MDVEAREFYNSGAVPNELLDALPSKVFELMQRIRPHAVRLVDAWKIPDYQLDRLVYISSMSACPLLMQE